MQRFKIKLNGMEMKVMAMTVVNAGTANAGVESLQSLIDMETLERLWSRLRNMYRPDKQKFTVQLSAIEADVIMRLVIPYTMNNSDGYVISMCQRLEESLINQVSAAINIYNSMGYAQQY